MISPAPIACAQSRLRFAFAAIVVMLLGAPSAADAQGLVQGVQKICHGTSPLGRDAIPQLFAQLAPGRAHERASATPFIS